MPDIKAILLKPAEGDPHGLLKEGPCGARPPTAYWYKRAWAPCTAKAAHSHDKRRALVLAWGGKPVREGCYRAADASGYAPSAVSGAIECALVYAPMNYPDDTHLKLHTQGRDPDVGMTAIAYDKGYFFLRLIENTVGRERFDAWLSGYFEAYAFKGMDTEYFVDYLKSTLLQDQADRDAVRLDEWIYGPGLPDNCPVVASPRIERVDAARAQEHQFRRASREERIAEGAILFDQSALESVYDVRGLFEIVGRGKTRITADERQIWREKEAEEAQHHHPPTPARSWLGSPGWSDENADAC